MKLSVAAALVVTIPYASAKAGCSERTEFQYEGCSDIVKGFKCRNELLCSWDREAKVCTHVCDGQAKWACKQTKFQDENVCTFEKGPSFSKADPLFEIDLDTYGEVHPAKMDMGPDGKLYFTGGTDSRAYRGDDEGNFEMFAEITTGAGFTLGSQFDGEGNYFIVNGAGVYKVDADDILDTSPTLPIEPTMFYEWTTGPLIPMSIDIDNNKGMAYVSDMGKGEIWRIDTATGDGNVWASSNDDVESKYGKLLGETDSTNFLGVAFGVVEVMVDAESNWLYFSAHERNFFGRIRIEENGDAGDLQVLAVVDDRAALNGAFLDVRKNRLYGATPFLNFHNGVAREPKATRGGEIWMLDLNDVNDEGEGGKAVRILKDLAYGTLTDIITGYGFGDGEADHHEDCLYLLDGSFDTLTWPTGIVPDPTALYHGAVRKIKIVEN